jgi:endonuclease/exonuclease/phosphatase family metal-dependent hydrolase
LSSAGVVIKKTLKICVYNVENLFLAKDDILYHPGQELKSKKKVEQLAKAITNIDADIYALSEVGGEKSLEVLNKDYLNDSYDIYFHLSNSDRGIHNGYLVKKDLDYKIKVKTNKTRPINFNFQFEVKTNRNRKAAGLKPYYKSHLFSRDALELHLTSKSKKNPDFILLNTHLKSQWDRKGYDFRGEQRRKHEFSELLNIRDDRQVEFPDAHILLMGDFNGNASDINTDPEFKSIYQNEKLDYRDILSLLKLPKSQRCTFVAFHRTGKQLIHQLDYLFLPPALHNHIITEESGVYYYMNDQSAPLPIPGFKNQKQLLPSDHYPICVSLKIDVS